MSAYTEKEANNKFCQETFAADSPTLTCRGSMCMAWRWLDSTPKVIRATALDYSPEQGRKIQQRQSGVYGQSPYEEPDPRPKHVPPSYKWQSQEAIWVEPEEEEKARTKGYCGLAGKPHHD